MDLFNKAMAQLADQFRSMSAPGRMTVGLLLLAIVIGAAYLFNHPLSESNGYLFGGEPVAASQLPAIEAAFKRAAAVVPGSLTSSYFSTHNLMYVSRGRHTTFVNVYPTGPSALDAASGAETLRAQVQAQNGAST